MKKYVYLLPLLALVRPACAQHIEIVERAAPNLSWYSGPDASGTSFINRSSDGGVYKGGAYTNSPYGKHAGLGLGLGLRALRVGKRAGLLVVDLGYDWQRTRTDIVAVSNVDWSWQTQTATQAQYAADGETFLHSQNISLFAGYGHRFGEGIWHLDVLAGPELTAIVGSRESGEGTFNNGRTWLTDTRRTSLGLDGRLRSDLTAWRGRAGLNASYSTGLISAQSGLVGGPVRQSFGQVVRFGIAYRLN
jgi:hypothetical protein